MTDKKNNRYNPAALGALLRGDFENALIAQTPGGIEAQEAQGQTDFVASETLPRECIGCTREQLKQIGVRFGENADDLFVRCSLPEGWSKSATEHSMHSDLLDEQGRKRGGIFYKAAFYDRSAHISLNSFYSIHVEPIGGYDNPEHKTQQWQCYVRDSSGSDVWETVKLRPEPTYADEQRGVWLQWQSEKDALYKAGAAYLDENFPDWRNPVAYWAND